MIKKDRTNPVEDDLSKPGVVGYRIDGSFGRAILAGLQRKSHVYAGSVPAEVVASRRVKNRAARAARRVHRLAAG